MKVLQILHSATLPLMLIAATLAGGPMVKAADQGGSTAAAVRIVAVLKAKPGREAETRAALLAVVPLSRAEPGCVHYEINQSADDPASFVFYELWRSRADLDAHFEKPYFKALAGRLDALLAQPADLRILATITP